MHNSTTNGLVLIAKTLVIIVLSIATIPYVKAQSSKDSTSFITYKLLPEKGVIPIFTADQRTYRLSLANRLGSNDFIGGIGGLFRLAEARKKDQIIQFTIASAVYNTLTRYLRTGTLVNADFYVDLNLDMQFTPNWKARLGAGHTSHHLSDDVVMQYQGINYVRDYYQVFGVYESSKQNWMVYAGCVYNHNFKLTDGVNAIDISGKPLFQLGFAHDIITTGKRSLWYWAGDVKFRGEHDYGTTQNLQTGIRFKGHASSGLRIAANWSSGYEERGQFYRKQVNFTSLGLYFEF